MDANSLALLCSTHSASATASHADVAGSARASPAASQADKGKCSSPWPMTVAFLELGSLGFVNVKPDTQEDAP